MSARWPSRCLAHHPGPKNPSYSGRTRPPSLWSGSHSWSGSGWSGQRLLRPPGQGLSISPNGPNLRRQRSDRVVRRWTHQFPPSAPYAHVVSTKTVGTTERSRLPVRSQSASFAVVVYDPYPKKPAPDKGFRRPLAHLGSAAPSRDPENLWKTSETP